MEDDELQAIRAARMAELRKTTNTGGGSGMNPSFSGGSPAVPGTSSTSTQGQEEQLAQQEEMKRQILSQILDSDARERLSRIGLVKPQKARQITDMLVRMAQSGQVRQRLSEDQLIGLLDQVDQASGSGDPSTGKITFTRKRVAREEEEDDDFDL